MTNVEDNLHLPCRGDIELAWTSVQITGGAPTLTPILDFIMDNLPPSSAANREQGASLYLSGESASTMKGELIASLGIVAEYLKSKPELSAAATELLRKLGSRELEKVS